MAVDPFAFMAVNPFPLMAVLVLGLLLIGGIVAVVALLANPNTRAAGVVLLAIGLLVVVGGVLLLGFAIAVPAVQRSKSLARSKPAHIEATRRQDEEMARQRAEMLKAEAQTAEEFQRNFPDQMLPTPQGPGEPPAPPAAESETAPAPPPKAESQPEAAAPPADPAAGPPPAAADASSKAEEGAPKPTEPPAAEKRPAWVDSRPQVVGNVYQTAVKTDPRLTQQECEAELPKLLRDAVGRYAETELDRSAEVAQDVQLPLTYIQDRIVTQKWLETVHVSLPGNWVRLHVLLEFNQEATQQIQKECERAQQRLDQQWLEAGVVRRLWYGGTGLGAVLALLALLFACLKIDQATAGAWRGRLFLAGTAGTIVVAGAACVGMYLLQRAGGMELAPPAVPQIEPATYSLLDPGSPQPAAAAILHPAKLTVLSIGLLLLGTLAVALTISRKARPIGLALLALVLLGGLAIVLAVVRSHAPVGPVELLVITVVVALPVCVLYAVVAFAWRTRRRRVEVEAPARQSADVGVGQP
jgi:hypothetical protein